MMLGAVVLAAGMSRRMGAPKPLLRWGNTTIIEHVIQTLRHAGIEEIIVVAGASFSSLSSLLDSYECEVVLNPLYEIDEMMASVQCGIRRISAHVNSAFIVLADQPQIEPEVIEELIKEHEKQPGMITIPSYQMRRGHPWIVPNKYFNELLSMKVASKLYEFLFLHTQDIHYVDVNTPSILKDVDTPADYEANKPRS